MTSALLTLALQLLIAASGPNVPQALRLQVIQTATYAIQYSQQQVASTTIAAAVPVKPIAPATPTTQIRMDDGSVDLIPTKCLPEDLHQYPIVNVHEIKDYACLRLAKPYAAN